MYSGKLIFNQVISHLPMHTFDRCVRRYRGDFKVKSFKCRDQFLFNRQTTFASIFPKTSESSEKPRTWATWRFWLTEPPRIKNAPGVSGSSF